MDNHPFTDDYLFTWNIRNICNLPPTTLGTCETKLLSLVGPTHVKCMGAKPTGQCGCQAIGDGVILYESDNDNSPSPRTATNRSTYHYKRPTCLQCVCGMWGISCSLESSWHHLHACRSWHAACPQVSSRTWLSRRMAKLTRK